MLAAIGEFFREAGSFIFLNVGVLGVALVLIPLKLWRLHWQGRIDGLPFLSHIDGILRFDTVKTAARACRRWPGAAVPRVVQAGLEAASEGEDAVARAVEHAEIEEVQWALRGHRTLPSLAQIAVLLGLLGTLTHMFTGSTCCGMATPEHRAALLTMGIAEAMNHTAFGLLVAALCTFGQLGVRSLVQSILGDTLLAGEYIKLAIKDRVAGVDLLPDAQASAETAAQPQTRGISEPEGQAPAQGIKAPEHVQAHVPQA